MRFLAHLSGMGAKPPFHSTSNPPQPVDLVTPHNLEKLRGLKIQFLYGAENAVWSPQATKRSYDTLRDVYPEGMYERVIVEGYGHLDCWMGYRACEDIWGRVGRWIGMCGGDEEVVEEGYVEVGEEVV